MTCEYHRDSANNVMICEHHAGSAKTWDNFRAAAGSGANTLNFDHISQLIKREKLLKKKKVSTDPKMESLVLSSRSEKQDLILI